MFRRSFALAPALALVLAFPTAAPVAGPLPDVWVVGAQFVPHVSVVMVGGALQWGTLLGSHSVTTDDPPYGLLGQANDPSNSDGDPSTFRRPIEPDHWPTYTFAEEAVIPYHCYIHYRLGTVGALVVVDPNVLP